MTSQTKRLLYVLGCGLALLWAAGWLFVDVAARRSSFCSNCHYMAPFVAQWKTSSHSGVECVQCHPAERRAMLGQFVKTLTRTYNPRPRAFVPDSSCLADGCHVGMDANKKVPFLSVSFPHQPHMASDRRGIKLHCASCHGSSLEAGHVSVDKKVCFLCHFKGQPAGGTIGACGGCHGAPAGITKHAGFQFDMQAYVKAGVKCDRCHLTVHEGEGEVQRYRCYACHVSRVEKIGEEKLLHDEHVGRREVRCLDCHEPIRHGNVKVLSVLDVSCESCHQNLHAGPKEMYLGVGAKGAESTPSRMFAAQINCTGCHTQVTVQGGVSFLGQGSKTADPKACAACHDARYMPMIGRWKSEGSELSAEAKRLAAEGARIAARAPSDSEVQRLRSDLEFNARFLEQGHPVHNIEYAIKIVQASGALLNELAGRLKTTAPGPIHLDFARGAFSYCNESCHTFIPRKEPYDFQGVDFPHTYHVKEVGLSCDTCHMERRHKEMALAGPSDCASCHHESATADCARCHKRQAALFNGTVPAALGIRAKADAMAGSVGCADCHDPTNADALKEVAKACVGCHEDQGAKDLESWYAKAQAEREKSQMLLEEAGILLDGLNRRGSDVRKWRENLKVQQARIEFLNKAGAVHNMVAAEAEYVRACEALNALLTEAGGQSDGGKKAQ